MRSTMMCLFAVLTLATFGCKSTPTFPAVFAPETGVGSILVAWTSPKKTTWVCPTARPDTKPSTAPASGVAAESQQVSAKIQADLYGWVTAQGGYDYLDSITVSLDDGQIEAAPLSAILVTFNSLPPECQTAIRAQEQGGAKWFTIATKLYRGTVSVQTKLKSGASVEAKAEILKKLESDLSAKVEGGSNSDASLKVQGGIWIVESEPYNVPAPGAAQ